MALVVHPIMSDQTAKIAASYLIKNDIVLAPIVKHVGICTFRPHKDYYQELVEAIIGQQLSVKAAATITKRFVALFGSTFPKPQHILEKSIDELRSVGLSRARAGYVQDLAHHIADGSIKFDDISTSSNDSIIRELTAVKGIGEWTAHMFLLFAVGRTDVLPTGDLGIRTGVQRLYSLDKLPSPEELKYIAAQNNWHPYESIACWYVWQAQDTMPSL